jgi:hypothetical protein
MGVGCVRHPSTGSSFVHRSAVEPPGRRASSAEKLQILTPPSLARGVLVDPSMGRTAGQPARVAAPVPPRAPVSSVAPRPAAECHTVREILPPWHVLQDKLQKRADAVATGAVVPADEAARQALAAQEAANEQWMPAAELEIDLDDSPSSGIRVSDAGPDSSGAIDSLSFKVYTLAELERRSDAPVSMRMSRANFDNTGARAGARWKRVYDALRAFGVASLAWWRTAAPRPNPKVALRQPFDVLGDELQVAVESVDWKKHGVTTGIVIGASLTLLFAVLTAAELTDDLKPGAANHLASSETSVGAKPPPDVRGVAPATNMAAMGVQPVAPAPIVIAPPAAAEGTTIGDIDEPEAAPTPAKRPAAKKAKPKSNKLSFRNADAVFNP